MLGKLVMKFLHVILNVAGWLIIIGCAIFGAVSGGQTGGGVGGFFGFILGIVVGIIYVVIIFGVLFYIIEINNNLVRLNEKADKLLESKPEA